MSRPHAQLSTTRSPPSPRATARSPSRILREAIRIPADYVDRPVEEGGDPLCGLSNHEGPRLEYLSGTIVEIGAVRRAGGRRLRRLRQPRLGACRTATDGIPAARQAVIYLDGHADTVQALRAAVAREDERRHRRLRRPRRPRARRPRGAARPSSATCRPTTSGSTSLFGRGSADQLAGVVSQIVATKILLELAAEGALRGVIVRSYATAAEEDNDGGGPLHLMGHVLPGAPPELVPDVVDPHRGHRRREEGRARHLPRPARPDADRGRGDRPLVPRLDAVGGPQPARARRRDRGRGGAALRRARGLPRPPVPRPRHAHRLVGEARHARATAPSPSGFTFRFDRRLTIGETPEQARARRRGARRRARGARGRAARSTSACRPTARRPGAATWPTTRRSTRAG